jgi:hypothetical protein
MTFCPTCNIPADAQVFDQSRIVNIRLPNSTGDAGRNEASLAAGESLELARFTLDPEHCGVLLYFAQFTDSFASDPSNVLTPGYRWAILADDYPLAPWLTFEHIINPWGMAGFPLAQPLEEKTVIRLVIENINVPSDSDSRWLRRVGGRIVGRYWFAHEHRSRQILQTRQPW